MSSEPSGFGDFPWTEEHHYLCCRCRYAATDYCSPHPAVEHIFDAYRRVNREGTRAGDRDREADGAEYEDVLLSLIQPDRHPEPLIQVAPLHYENTD